MSKGRAKETQNADTTGLDAFRGRALKCLLSTYLKKNDPGNENAKCM